MRDTTFSMGLLVVTVTIGACILLSIPKVAGEAVIGGLRAAIKHDCAMTTECFETGARAVCVPVCR